MNLKNRDFISLMNFSNEELQYIMRLSEDIKNGADVSTLLKSKNIGLLFGVASTRTRISFQVGVQQMGGHGEYYNAQDLQLINKESLIDTARVLERYIDGLVVRMYDMNNYGAGRIAINKLAENTDIPVINALDDKDHPCQVMGDILTVKEKLGNDYKKKKVVVTWGYAERQKSPGVPHSLMTAGSILGMNMVIAHPKGFDLDEEYVEFSKKQVQSSGGKLEFSNDLMEASEGADVIYVKSWKSLKKSSDEDNIIRNNVRDKWCVTQNHFDRANPEAIFMNCLPIIRGEQATADVIDGKQSVIYDQAENRLHIQKAILAAIYGYKSSINQPEIQGIFVQKN